MLSRRLQEYCDYKRLPFGLLRVASPDKESARVLRKVLVQYINSAARFSGVEKSWLKSRIRVQVGKSRTFKSFWNHVQVAGRASLTSLESLSMHDLTSIMSGQGFLRSEKNWDYRYRLTFSERVQCIRDETLKGLKSLGLPQRELAGLHSTVSTSLRSSVEVDRLLARQWRSADAYACETKGMQFYRLRRAVVPDDKNKKSAWILPKLAYQVLCLAFVCLSSTWTFVQYSRAYANSLLLQRMKNTLGVQMLFYDICAQGLRCQAAKQHFVAIVADAGQFYGEVAPQRALDAGFTVFSAAASVGWKGVAVARTRKFFGFMTCELQGGRGKFVRLSLSDIFATFSTAVSVSLVSVGHAVAMLSGLPIGGLMSKLASSMVLCQEEENWKTNHMQRQRAGFYSLRQSWRRTVCHVRYVDDVFLGTHSFCKDCLVDLLLHVYQERFDVAEDEFPLHFLDMVVGSDKRLTPKRKVLQIPPPWATGEGYIRPLLLGAIHHDLFTSQCYPRSNVQATCSLLPETVSSMMVPLSLLLWFLLFPRHLEATWGKGGNKGYYNQWSSKNWNRSNWSGGNQQSWSGKGGSSSFDAGLAYAMLLGDREKSTRRHSCKKRSHRDDASSDSSRSSSADNHKRSKHSSKIKRELSELRAFKEKTEQAAVEEKKHKELQELEQRLWERLQSTTAHTKPAPPSSADAGQIVLSGPQRRLATKVLAGAITDQSSVQAWADIVAVADSMEGRQLLEVLRSEGLATPHACKERQSILLTHLQAELEIKA
ncbi:unnamed protein product [Symbiodinium sp. CCMP2592]|nr:unnamed protein product [Symbiodinium sp. CCMP2592]